MANQKVKVPQKDGEVVLSFGDDTPQTYKVTDGEVTVKDADVQRFLSNVDGSSLVGGSPSASSSSSNK
jgi:hypothetical protein